MTKLFIRIDFEPSGSALGPGMILLLEAIKEQGSIRRAAAALNMSYRKAWLLIQQMQKTFSGPVVWAEAGGYTGGGTGLTELGLDLLKHYHAVENSALAAARKDIDALSGMVRSDAPRRRPERS
jgi:molybdate transport system regulatory protein